MNLLLVTEVMLSATVARNLLQIQKPSEREAVPIMISVVAVVRLILQKSGTGL